MATERDDRAGITARILGGNLVGLAGVRDLLDPAGGRVDEGRDALRLRLRLRLRGVDHRSAGADHVGNAAVVDGRAGGRVDVLDGDLVGLPGDRRCGGAHAHACACAGVGNGRRARARGAGIGQKHRAVRLDHVVMAADIDDRAGRVGGELRGHRVRLAGHGPLGRGGVGIRQEHRAVRLDHVVVAADIDGRSGRVGRERVRHRVRHARLGLVAAAGVGQEHRAVRLDHVVVAADIDGRSSRVGRERVGHRVRLARRGRFAGVTGVHGVVGQEHRAILLDHVAVAAVVDRGAGGVASVLGRHRVGLARYGPLRLAATGGGLGRRLRLLRWLGQEHRAALLDHVVVAAVVDRGAGGVAGILSRHRVRLAGRRRLRLRAGRAMDQQEEPADPDHAEPFHRSTPRAGGTPGKPSGHSWMGEYARNGPHDRPPNVGWP